jgi:tight adherence protein C
LRDRPSKRQKRVERDLSVTLDEAGWTAAEWLATHRLGALIWAIGLGGGAGLVMARFWGYVFLPIFIGLVYVWRARSSLAALGQAADRVRGNVRRGLPFTIDLITLMLQGGSTFREALATLARQTPGNAWTGHLGRLLQDLDRGLPRTQALALFGGRIGMDEVDSLVFAIKQGETLGTPLTQVLASQATQVRDRRSQAIERAAERAKVRFALPGTLSMIACLITMLAPLIVSVGRELAKTFG